MSLYAVALRFPVAESKRPKFVPAWYCPKTQSKLLITWSRLHRTQYNFLNKCCFFFCSMPISLRSALAYDIGIFLHAWLLYIYEQMLDEFLLLKDRMMKVVGAHFHSSWVELNCPCCKKESWGNSDQADVNFSRFPPWPLKADIYYAADDPKWESCLSEM